MQRINDTTNDEKKRRDKRREKHRLNKLKKKNKKSRPLKPVFDIIDARNGTLKGTAPYFDPHQTHVHVWRSGTINSMEDHSKKYFSKIKKPFTGRYCIICHEPYLRFDTNLRDDYTVDYFDQQEKTLIDTINRYVSSQSVDYSSEMNVLVDKIDMIQLKDPPKPAIGERDFEYLFIVGSFCKYYHNKKHLHGKIVGIDEYPLLTIETQSGDSQEVHSNNVCPIYDEIDPKKEHLSPVGLPPKTVPKKFTPVVITTPKKTWKTTPTQAWNETWKYFVNWKSFVAYIKRELPAIVGNYQTFDEMYDPNEKLRRFHLEPNAMDYRMKVSGSIDPNRMCDVRDMLQSDILDLNHTYNTTDPDNTEARKSLQSRILELNKKIKKIKRGKKKRLYPFLVNKPPKRDDTYYKIIDDEQTLAREMKRMKI